MHAQHPKTSRQFGQLAEIHQFLFLHSQGRTLLLDLRTPKKKRTADSRRPTFLTKPVQPVHSEALALACLSHWRAAGEQDLITHCQHQLSTVCLAKANLFSFGVKNNLV